MKNYAIKKFKSRRTWLANRRIGGSDLACLVNRVGRWNNFIKLYDQLTTFEVDNADSVSMSNGRRAEEPIKELFLISHPELRRKNPKNEIWLMVRNDYPEITLSPDTIVCEKRRVGFIEIKLKQIYKEEKISEYLTDLKNEEPQYYWQIIHYFVTMNDCQFGYLVVCFDLLEKDGEDGKWEHSRYVIESLRITRKDVADDIALAESELTDFIVNNLRPRIRPKTILEGQTKEQIEWNNLSNIRTLKT